MGTQDQTGAKRIRGKPVPSQPGSHGTAVMNVPPLTGSREACDECRIRKVRCNKEYPKCSSCRKSNLACGFSNKGKRVNHTKKLVNDVEILGNRLGKIEEALIRCLSAVERSQTPSNAATRQSSVIPSDDSHTDLNDSPPTDGNTVTDASLETNPEQCNDHTFPGSTPIASLYTEAQAVCDRLRSLLPFSSPESQYSPASLDFIPDQACSLQSRLQEVSELFEKLTRESPVLSIPESDGLLPSLPPRALLETCLETYFACLSPFLPIYDRQSVISAIEEQYGPSINRPDPAWVISFNNILLQTLDARYSAATRAGSITHNILEEELIKSLLLNYRRGYNNFERLLRPQLANVQALLSMALIALKYFSLATFETVFAQACQLAKSIGLHQSSSDSENAEQIDLWWSLFIIDKHASFMAGKPCLLPSYDCGLPFPAANSEHIPRDQRSAHISLARIQEDVYQHLYSAQTAHKGRDYILRQAQQINRTLDEWEIQHKHILSPASTMTAQEAFRLTELRYTLCTLRVLTRRLEHSSNNRCSRLEYARAGLRLLQETCDTRGDSVVELALYQSFCLNYSMTLYLELFIAVMKEYQQDHRIETELLSSFAAHMNFFSTKSSPTSQASKAAYMTSLCTNIALGIQMQDDGFPHQLALSRPNSAPDSPGLTTISAASTFGPEILESSSSTVGIPTSIIGDPSWELSSFATDGNLNMKMHETQAKSYEQYGLLAGSTPTTGFAYRPELAGMGSMEFDAMLDTFASYDHVGGLMHHDRI
ncbi:Zn(II)2Cys6 transcription factor [Aspergillus fischeri NRRL 181]|uniref:C6 transcription factor, putative n=1 Tax=Neosartorya fischeri (strain ATCC 1020 / DSM 3700 / CBS 544.65 / FGSC A1164 / JCM 1740 / NRRL 181 / WB 181) TaxID=331117 RepID=A1DD89_NEOFI|nr:C6 transcription factor, putative [Aspergillus fischeri NRRL 181]EAW17346.1 C6 transcription factor, putative [Aspergillus fischeri NRRL 181]